MEALTVRHKEEKQVLQAKVQALKRSIPKGDKRKNKEVKAQIGLLETELAEKQARELKEITKSAELVNGDGINGPTGPTELVNGVEAPTPKLSKAKRNREKKALKAKQQAEIASQAEKDYVNTQRYAEEKKITNLLAELKLEVKPMVSDGNCLYYAVEDQLKLNHSMLHHSSKELRKLASEFMLAHADDFLPFLVKPDTGDGYTFEEFEHYCYEVAETSAWGGQLELRALSHVLKAPIHVVQADIPTVKIGEEYDGPPIILTYHHHELGLGEHYNSVRPLKPDNEEER